MIKMFTVFWMYKKEWFTLELEKTVLISGFLRNPRGEVPQ